VNPYASDYIPRQEFTDTIFEDVAEGAFAFLMDPPEKWHHPDDCIGFTCTAPSNILMQFQNTQFLGTTTPDNTDSKFQVISDTAEVSNTMENCAFNLVWNAWHCTNDNLGVLIAIADDGDAFDRMVSPVWLTNEAT